jgi:sporulation protein YlmC with PRC-barrel domain
MKINNPHELVGKEVVDTNGNTLGWIDKMWSSWNHEYPGYFFGIRSNANTRDTWFRGTTKLIPIYSEYIREYGDRVTICKTTEELCRFWNKTIHCGPKTYPTEALVDMPIYDQNYSRVGTCLSWVESDGTYKNYGCLVDPYLCETWKVPYNTVMPVPTDYIKNVADAITLDKTLDELKTYWKQHYNF